MTTKVALVRDAITDESRKWLELVAEMKQASSSIDGLELNLLAFMPGNIVTAVAAKEVYESLHQSMIALAAEAVEEFADIADALKRALDLLEEAEAQNAFDIRRVYET